MGQEDRKRFEAFRRQFQLALVERGWTKQATLTIRDRPEVLETLTLRVDPVGQLDVEVWLYFKLLPGDFNRARREYGQVTASLYAPKSECAVDHRQWAPIASNRESWQDFIEDVVAHQVEPFLAHFPDTETSLATIRDKHVDLHLAVFESLWNHLGMVRSTSWTFGPALTAEEVDAWYTEHTAKLRSESHPDPMT